MDIPDATQQLLYNPSFQVGVGWDWSGLGEYHSAFLVSRVTTVTQNWRGFGRVLAAFWWVGALSRSLKQANKCISALMASVPSIMQRHVSTAWAARLSQKPEGATVNEAPITKTFLRTTMPPSFLAAPLPQEDSALSALFANICL